MRLQSRDFDHVGIKCASQTPEIQQLIPSGFIQLILTEGMRLMLAYRFEKQRRSENEVNKR